MQKKPTTLSQEYEEDHQFENPKGSCPTFRILNQHFRMLEEQLKKQFKVDKMIIIPLIQQ